jgi:hypothetical protein
VIGIILILLFLEAIPSFVQFELRQNALTLWPP